MVDHNLEQNLKDGTDGPSLDYELGTRIKEMIEHIGYDQAAAVSGKSSRTIARYVSGHEASFSALAKIAEATGTSLEWLATGQGEKYQKNNLPKPGNINLDSLKNVIEVLETYFKNNRLSPDPEAKARIFIEVYNLLMKEYQNETFDAEFLKENPNVVMMAAFNS